MRYHQRRPYREPEPPVGFRVKPTYEQRLYAAKIQNIGNRGSFDGNREQQYAGMLAQTVMADLLQTLAAAGHGGCDMIERPSNEKGFDDGIDFVLFGVNVDLKAKIVSVPPRMKFVQNVHAPQVVNKRYLADAYMFADVKKPKEKLEDTEIFFLGAFLKSRITEDMWRGAGEESPTRKGWKYSADMFEIPTSSLIPTPSMVELLWSVHRIALELGRVVERPKEIITPHFHAAQIGIQSPSEAEVQEPSSTDEGSKEGQKIVQ